MYNFLYLFFLNIIIFIVQANYIGIKLLYIGMNIPAIRKTFILHLIWKTYSTTPMMLIFIDQLCFKETQFYTKLKKNQVVRLLIFENCFLANQLQYSPAISRQGHGRRKSSAVARLNGQSNPAAPITSVRTNPRILSTKSCSRKAWSILYRLFPQIQIFLDASLFLVVFGGFFSQTHDYISSVQEMRQSNFLFCFDYNEQINQFHKSWSKYLVNDSCKYSFSLLRVKHWLA